MATKKQLERKKKERENKARARVQARRHKLGVMRRQDSREAKLQRKFRDKIAPIVKDPEARARLGEAENKRTLQKLERNAQILKALEEEYAREKDQKKALNESLESAGHVTLKEKLGALESEARKQINDDVASSGGIDATTE